MNLRKTVGAEDPLWETTAESEPPFSHLEILQNRASLTAEQLSNLIGMECSSEWAASVQRLADAFQSQLNEMLEVLSDLAPQKPYAEWQRPPTANC